GLHLHVPLRDQYIVAWGVGVLIFRQFQLPGGWALPAAELLHARSALFVPGSCFEPTAPQETRS
ncbi:MAG: hypothetical protein RLP45_17170, partial [Haliea sp.]